MSSFTKAFGSGGLRLGALASAVLPVALGAVAVLTVFRFVAFFVLASGTRGFAAWVEDDFFYYAVIAQNIADTGRSTFDQVALSNGYHPLWMAVCVVIAKIFPISTAGFFLAIFAVQTALVVAGVLALTRLLDKAVAEGLIGRGGQLAAATVYGVIFSVNGANGMEIALLAPLAPMLLLTLWRLAETPDLRRAMIAGGLLCAAILSRLDMAVVFAPACIGVLATIWRKTGFAGVIRLWPALATMAPLLAYLAMNQVIFHAAMPLSGLAKRLTVENAPFGFSMRSLASLFEVQNDNFWLAPVGVLVATIGGTILVAFDKRLRSSIGGAGFLLLVGGVVVFHAQTALTSDWRLWMWYFFALILAGSISAGLLVDAAVRAMPATLAIMSRWGPLMVAALVLAFAVKANLWLLKKPPAQSNALFTRAIPLAEFAKSHPGRYAVGDGGGAVGYLLPGGAAHLEGLVNDKAMLDDLRAQGTISDSLKRQGVDFYITSLVGDAPEGCREVVEPLQAGPKAPHISQQVCEKPLFTSQTDWISSQVWDVRDGLN